MGGCAVPLIGFRALGPWSQPIQPCFHASERLSSQGKAVFLTVLVCKAIRYDGVYNTNQRQEGRR